MHKLCSRLNMVSPNCNPSHPLRAKPNVINTTSHKSFQKKLLRIILGLRISSNCPNVYYYLLLSIDTKFLHIKVIGSYERESFWQCLGPGKLIFQVRHPLSAKQATCKGIGIVTGKNLAMLKSEIRNCWSNNFKKRKSSEFCLF